MSLGAVLAFLALCTFMSGVFSGCETGFYRLSGLRVDARASQGHLPARVIRWLLQDDAGLLITILIGNNLMLEVATHLFDLGLVSRAGLPVAWREVATTVVLTPTLFFFGELFPKDLFRRRPHVLMRTFVWVIAAARILFLPLAWPLRQLARLLERLAGVSQRGRALGAQRETLLDLLDEGARRGTFEREAHSLVNNVLQLQNTPVARVMVPWKQVTTIPAEGEDAVLRRAVAQSNHSRLPAREADGSFRRYVHQLDVLGQEELPVTEQLRPLTCLPPDLSVDRALAKLRGAGQRVALVGVPEHPVGLVALKDLVEEISGDLWGW